jgi:hypothetical protein
MKKTPFLEKLVFSAPPTLPSSPQSESRHLDSAKISRQEADMTVQRRKWSAAYGISEQ